MNFGLAAHRLHRMGTDSTLLRWARLCEPALPALGLTWHATGGAHDTLVVNDLFRGQLMSVGYGRDGGLMRLVSRIAGGLTPEAELDGVFFFIDPVNPTSIFPEAQALKRQCVIHGKPFVATFFAMTHFDTLSRFAGRVATGTTGSRLNAMAWSRGWPASQPWVTCYQSGPLGGDSQIAELVLNRRCQKVIFFEDPHVARQHEADIQLLDRAVYSAGDVTTCFNTPAMAGRWAEAISKKS